MLEVPPRLCRSDKFAQCAYFRIQFFNRINAETYLIEFVLELLYQLPVAEVMDRVRRELFPTAPALSLSYVEASQDIGFVPLRFMPARILDLDKLRAILALVGGYPLRDRRLHDLIV